MLVGELNKIVASGVKLTPMMAQYVEIKKNFPETILLFRMGDFYEVFFDDAKDVSKLLNITLTSRGKLGEHPILMAGIPHHAANTYIDKITQAGLKAAICEQIEDPTMAKGIVKRAVTQIVGPAIPFDLNKTEEKSGYYLASAHFFNHQYHVIFLDFTNGNFFGHVLSSQADLIDKLKLHHPKEMLAYLGQWDDQGLIKNCLQELQTLTTFIDQDYFEVKKNKEFKKYIEKLIPNFERDEIIKLHPELLCPMAALAFYLVSTQSIEKLFHIKPFRFIGHEKRLNISQNTLMGLEILPKHHTYRGQSQDSLLGFFDRTLSTMGYRSLRNIFLHPLIDKKKILERQKIIAGFLGKIDQLELIREELKKVRDIERILAKVSTGKVSAQDLLNLAQTIEVYFILVNQFEKIQELQELKDIAEIKLIYPQPSLRNIFKLIQDEILNTLNDELGAHLDKGNLIKNGADKTRDRLYKLSQNAHEELLKLEEKYKAQAKISKLKIKYNNLNGYFIEVSKSHADKLPSNFKRQQTLVNTERFMTDELSSFEKEVLHAKEKLLQLEKEIFKNLIVNVSLKSFEFIQLAETLGHIDALQAMAWVTFNENFSCPQVEEHKKILDVKLGWHPLIKNSLKDRFVGHNLKLNQDEYFALITGPNMAGKTTVMREMAIIQFLTQIGSFVPAKQATVGLCDFIFSRLGASDDILKGQSTFMVEMAETAEILRHATDKSLIVLDEVGRGTSTFDGLAIAWSLVEYFVNEIKALTLFSTHYHELIDLVEQLPGAKNFTVKTSLENGTVVFHYQLIEQGANQSFGLHVAKMAGLPTSVLSRGRQMLAILDQKDRKSLLENEQVRSTQPSLFEFKEEIEPSFNITNKLKSIDLNNTTPLQAFQQLKDLQDFLH
jgi:DNA mismatch repair protein MutS